MEVEGTPAAVEEPLPGGAEDEGAEILLAAKYIRMGARGFLNSNFFLTQEFSI